MSAMIRVGFELDLAVSERYGGGDGRSMVMDGGDCGDGWWRPW